MPAPKQEFRTCIRNEEEAVNVKRYLAASLAVFVATVALDYVTQMVILKGRVRGDQERVAR